MRRRGRVGRRDPCRRARRSAGCAPWPSALSSALRVLPWPDRNPRAGGDITGLPENLVAMAVRGFEQMPAVELTREEIAAITAWLDHLASR
ncbi:MAG: hypothetical protein JKP98_01995 [Rhodobacteraceae bacterium]|nr:hypothetical protein [Paracoccaceae bacterium]